VKLSWPNERLFSSLFGLGAINGNVSRQRLHAAIHSAQLNTGTSVGVDGGRQPANYAVVRGPVSVVQTAVAAVKAAVEAFVKTELTEVPMMDKLSPAEVAFLAAPPRTIAEDIAQKFGVLVDFDADDNCSVGHASTKCGNSNVAKPQLMLEATLAGGSGGGGGSSSASGKTVKVRVLHGDLLFSGCGAIVNAANGKLAHGGGVARVIANEAGPVFAEQCRAAVRNARGLLPTGEAVTTTAGAVLGSRGTTTVVHAVVPAWDSNAPPISLMKKAVHAALAAAESAGEKEVAIPLCGSGVYGWLASVAAEAVVGAILEYAADPATALQSIDLVDVEAPKVTAASNALAAYCGSAPKAAQAAVHQVPTPDLPQHQWFYFCPEKGVGPDARAVKHHPYDYDQNELIDAAYSAFLQGSGPNLYAIVGDAGGVKSNSKHGNNYTIHFQQRVEDCRQHNDKSGFRRELKRLTCVAPPPMFVERVAEAKAANKAAAAAAAGLGGGVGARFRITQDGRGSPALPAVTNPKAPSSVNVRGFTADAKKAAAELEMLLKAEWREEELRIDDAETPPAALLLDLQAGVTAEGVTVKLTANQHAVVVCALGDAARTAALLQCYAAKENARLAARAPPTEWEGSAAAAAADLTGAPFTRVDVDAGSAEWVKIAGRVSETLPAAKVTKVERVQNKKLWSEYARRRAEVAAESSTGFDANEVWCFHGTRSFPVNSACEFGLDFRHGNSASMWGTALYIAVNASYSHNYSSVLPDGQHQFFFARAALGRAADLPKDKSIRAPPKGHESVQGTTDGSVVHMLYNTGQAYPEYLVTYAV
jgi:O-acetyl-ADP-ribose deacetylase (regulator of RNase III)